MTIWRGAPMGALALIALALSFASWRAEALVVTTSDLAVEAASTAAEHVTDTTRMKDLFERIVTKEKGSWWKSPKAKDVPKVALGVFTTLSERQREIRKILRSTWMKHPSVCMLNNVTDNCAVRVVFVAGRSPNMTNMTHGTFFIEKKHSTAMEFLRSEPDVLLLNITENMDEGKSFAWFQMASQRFLWANYVAKCDDDVFPHVSPILLGMPVAKKDQCPQAYLGKAWTCLKQSWCPPRTCGPPKGHNFRQYHSGANISTCWAYMQGGFYALSRQMAFDITRPGTFFARNKVGPEDMQTGWAVVEYTRRTGNCVHTWSGTEVAFDRMYIHLRGRNEHPGHVSEGWDNYFLRPHKGARRNHDLYDMYRAFSKLLKQDRLPDSSKFPRSAKRTDAKVILGVFTSLTERGKSSREVVRNTWMQHPDVCTYDDVFDDCTIRVVFLANRKPSEPPARMKFLASESDVLITNTTKPDDPHKSLAWFKLASKEFVWADYIAQSEDDVFLHVTNIIDSLPTENNRGLSYLGNPSSCLGDHCPPKSCGPPLDHDLTKFKGSKSGEDCWTYMQGGFYALSRSLAHDILDSSTWSEQIAEDKLGEDMRLGRMISEYSTRTGKHVHIWNTSDVALDRTLTYYRPRYKRGGADHPGRISLAWERYYAPLDSGTISEAGRLLERFQDLMQQDQFPNKTFIRSTERRSTKIVLGIFTTLTDRDKAMRSVLRDTWMQHPDVCTYPDRTDACNIVVFFVACKKNELPINSGPVFLKNEDDVLLLNRAEVSGKAYAFFRMASRRFPWADYIGKAEQSVFLHAANFIDAMPREGGCKNAYLGSPGSCTEKKCPPPSCGPPAEGNLTQFSNAAGEKDCWSYMQKSLYVLSRPMAKSITHTGGFFDGNKVGTEDVQTGLAVAHYARENGTCVQVWNASTVAADRLYYAA